MSLNNLINTLLYEADNKFRQNGMTNIGAPVFVTYSFAQRGDFMDATGADAYFEISDKWKENFREALDIYEKYAGIKFVEVSASAQAAGTNPLILVQGVEGTSYYGSSHVPYSSENYEKVQVFSLSNKLTSTDPGSYEFKAILHELGHALGMKHPHDGDPVLPDEYDHYENTVMTYTGLGSSYVDLGELDKLTLNYLYGSEADFRSIEGNFYGETFVIKGSGKGETLIGVPGKALIEAESGKDRVFGRSDNDTLIGGNGNDTILGQGGDDYIMGGSGLDTLRGQTGNDELFGGQHNDLLEGGSGNDLLFGGTENDTLFGEEGDDSLFGDEGRDILNGGAGQDRLEGGDNADIFVFSAASSTQTDVIVDFEAGVDKIHIEGTAANFSDLKFANLGSNGVQVELDQYHVSITIHGIDASNVSSNWFEFT